MSNPSWEVCAVVASACGPPQIPDLGLVGAPTAASEREVQLGASAYALDGAAAIGGDESDGEGGAGFEVGPVGAGEPMARDDVEVVVLEHHGRDLFEMATATEDDDAGLRQTLELRTELPERGHGASAS